MISLYKDLCNIYKIEDVVNPITGVTEATQVLLASDVKCSLSMDSLLNPTNEIETTAKKKYTLFLDLSQEVKTGYKIEVTTQDSTFLAQKPFRYKYLNKQEIEVSVWG